MSPQQPEVKHPIMPIVSFPRLPLFHAVKREDVPPLFRKPFIQTGYRPPGHRWQVYAFSLFQMHNQTLTVWIHLLAAACIALRFTVFAVLHGGGILGFQLQSFEALKLSVDLSSLPLVLHVFSVISFFCCSAADHLFQSHSEQTAHCLHFLSCVTAAVCQYSCALVLHLYSASSTWTQSMLGQVFLPASAVSTFISCAARCCDELDGKFRHLVPMAASASLVVSPILHRLATHSQTMTLHCLQVALFLLATFFFCGRIPQRFAPGRFDVIGHQLPQFLLALCMLVQQEALFQDFLQRRHAMVRCFGEQRLLLASASLFGVVLCCGATALVCKKRFVKNHSENSQPDVL